MINQRGNILISVLFILIILSIVSSGAYKISCSASREAKFSEDNVQAYYIAKAGADIIIDNISEIRSKLEEGNEEYKSMEIKFTNRDKAFIKLDQVDAKEIIINSTGITNEGTRYESKSSIKASLRFNSSNGEVIVLGVDDNGTIYRFTREFDSPIKIHIDIDVHQNFTPTEFAWDLHNTLILVGQHKPYSLSCDLSNNTWISLDINGGKGNGFEYVTYSSKEKNLFYVINANNDKVFYSDGTKQWEGVGNNPNKPGIDIKKLAQGSNTIVGISKEEKGKITYFNDENKKWKNININGYDMYGTYNSIAYGNGKFVIVGNDGSYPIYIYSYNGVNWHKGTQENSMHGINYELNDITWTGDKFVAVGNSGTIYTSVDGEIWLTVPRKDIRKTDNLMGWGNYSMVSGFGDYIVAFSTFPNRRLVSTDGGESWTEKGPTIIEGNRVKLRDIIVINKGDGDSAPTNYSIIWSK